MKITDKMRVDWLLSDETKTWPTFPSSNGKNEVEWKALKDHNWPILAVAGIYPNDLLGRGPTKRAAVDAAINAEAKKVKP